MNADHQRIDEARALINGVAARSAGNITDEAVVLLAAKLLRGPAREIHSVTEDPAGILITMVHDVRAGRTGLYLVAPGDRADGEGYTGLMLTRKMGNGATTRHVYVPPGPLMPAASPPPVVADIDAIDTVTGAHEAQRAIKERLDLVKSQMATVTSYNTLERLEDERGRLERELEVLERRLPVLLAARERKRAADELLREDNSVRALQCCVMAADPILTKVRGLLNELEDVRQQAIQAGADRETVTGVVEDSATSPATGNRISAFVMVDRLAAYLDGQWPDVVATAQRLLDENPEPVRAVEAQPKRGLLGKRTR